MDVVGGGGGSRLTYTVASAGLEDTPRSLLGVRRELVVLQELGVSAQGQDLREEDTRLTATLYEMCKTGSMSPAFVSFPTCLRNVMGFWPMAWASPMLALMTSSKGFLTPFGR